MAAKVGIVQSINDGKFFTKDSSGNTKELKVGDNIYENEIVFSDGSNSSNSEIRVALEGEDIIVLKNGVQQLFDSSLIASTFGDEEMVFAKESIDAMLDSHSDITNVWSNLNEEGFSDYQDITEEETAAGEEEEEILEEGSIGQFALRDGALVDVISDLRKKSWIRTQNYKEVENSEALEKASLKPLGENIDTIVSIPRPIAPNPIDTIIPIAPTPETPIITEAPTPAPTEAPTEAPTDAPVPPPPPRTIIKVVAADENGYPIKDGDGNYKVVNEAPEGGKAYYVALAFEKGSTVFNDTTKLATQEGTVDFTFTDGTATTDDYTPPAGLTNIALGTAFITADAKDDYIADNGEKFTVTIGNYTPPTVPAGDYGATTVNNTGVTTTITDNSKPNGNNPHNPNDTTNHTTEGAGEQDIVMIKLFAADENGNVIKDGSGNYQLANSADEVVGSKANYIAYAFKNGETSFKDGTRLDTQIGQVNVEFANGTATGVESSTSTQQDGTADYNKTAKTIQIGTAFSTEVFKDTTSDLGEKYTVKLIDNTYASYNGNGYESVDTDNIAVTTTIKERLFAKIEVVNAGDNVANEGGNLTYTVTIVDENGNPITVTSDATVHLNYEGLSTNPATKTTDYTAQDTVIVTSGTTTKTFTLPAIDDYFAEGDEQLRITITEIDYNNNNFSIKPHTTANGANADKIVVDGTIKDNPATVKQPISGTGEDVPGGTATYGAEDTVYVKITEAPSTIEGGNLVHTVTLVDKDGVAVKVPEGKTVTVTLAYTHLSSTGSGTFTEDDLSTIIKTVTITGAVGGTSSVDFTNITKDDFTAEGNEVYTVTITDVSQSGAFENVAISTTNNSTTGTIIDGVTLGVPTNATVDEDNFDMATNVTTITDTKLLNIVSPNGDNAYNLLFDGTPTFTSNDGSFNTADGDILKSDGTVIEYVVSGNTTTAYAGAGRTATDKVFVITLDKNAAGGANDSYTYTQYKNIDHPISGTGVIATDDDNVVLTFGYKITDQGQTSSVQNFTVTVNDSLPSGTGQNVTLNEDSSKTIYISDESFKDGKITLNNTKDGDQEVIKDGTINIYDTALNDVVGSLKNNGDGTLTFTPNADYSGPTAGFSYQVSDGDGDTANATIGITVKPVADAPDLSNKTVATWEDANTTDAAKTDGNIREGGNVKVLGLVIPVKKDQMDQNDGDVTNGSGTSLGDNPERLGAIEFSFATSGDFGTATIGYDTDGNGTLDGTLQTITKTSTFTVVISDVANYHVTGTTGTHTLTKAQYESIAIKHAEDNATNIKTKIEVASHEVDENGNVYSPDIVSTKATQIITLDIKAVTDNITALEFNTGDVKTHTVTMAATEGSATIDIATLLNPQVLGDNDGSEKRWYEISATSADKKLPEGTIITIGGSKGTVGADGTVSINFPDNKAPNPTFTIDFPEQFGQLDLDLDVTITLKVQDRDSDSSVTPDIKTDSVNLKITGNITPVADIATIQVSQAVGFEDAGRDGGNTTAKSGTINANGTGGIPLAIKVSSDDKDGSEKFDVIISGIPAGAVIYYDGAEKAGASITIVDFDNAKSLVIIPPHNSDADFTLNVSATTKDGASVSAPTVTTIDVIVKNVADAPVGTDLNTGINVNEDNQLNFQSIYTTPANLASYDATEVLTVKIELPTGFSIDSGSPFYIENGLYVVKASDITAGNIKLVVPENFSGNAELKLTYVTTEKAGEGDSKTWDTQTVNIFVNPIADDVTVTTSSTINEDADGSTNKIDLKATLKDTGTTNGTETIDSVKILASTVPAGYELFLGSANGTSIASKLVGGYYVLTSTEADSVYAKNTTAHDLNSVTSFPLTVVYTVKDTNGTVTNTDEFTHTHTVNVKAVTDAPTLIVGTITQESGSVTISGSNVTVVNENSQFKVPVTTTSSDKDGSEAVTKIVISGVPMGVEVVGGTYYGYSGSEHNGIWVVTPSGNPATKLDTDGALSDITFKVNTGADFAARDMTITTYTQDGTGADVKNASQTIHIDKSYTASGTGPGNPPLFDLSTKSATIYEDNNDGSSAVVYNLGKSIDVANSGGSASGNYAITITDFPTGTTVSGASYSYVEGGKTYYVITGTGNAADVVTKLSTVLVTPPTDMNTGGAKDGQMTFSATISTYDGGTFAKGTGIPSYTETIIPVTDKMTVAVTADNINEDATSNLSITLTNPSDGSKAVLVGNSLTITVTETWADAATGGGTKGTLSGTGYNITESPSGTYTITKTDGTAFPIGTAITGLQYTPASNRDGSVKFDVSVQNKEGTSITLDSTGNKTITVTPVVDVVLNASVVTATGTEDTAVTVGTTTLANPVKLNITAGTFADGSEKLGNIILDEVPNGFTVWYNNGTTLVMATNIGTTGGTAFDLTPNISGDANVARNKWLVPVTDGTLPDIYVNAPVNWSGDFDFDAHFIIKEANLTSTTSQEVQVTGHIDSVADTMTIAPTLTFGDAYSWVDLKLNANMVDVDGSETMSLKITGLDDMAKFQLANGSAVTAVHDGTSTWTLSGVTYDQINNIQFAHDKSVASVGVIANTVEIGNTTEGTPASATFELKLSDVSGAFKLDAGLSLDFSKIDTISTLKNISEIDLKTAGKNELLNLSLQDVLDMSGSGKEIKISGIAEDKVSFKGTGWSKTTGSGADAGFDIYSNTGNADVKVKVEPAITDGITN